MAPVDNTSSSSNGSVIGAVFAVALGGMIVLAIGYLVFLRRKTNDNSPRKAPIPLSNGSTSGELPPSSNAVVPSVVADPVLGSHGALRNSSTISHVPFAAAAPIPDTDGHRVSYKDQCRPSTQPMARRANGALPAVRASDTVGAVDRSSDNNNSLPCAMAVAVAHPSSFVQSLDL